MSPGTDEQPASRLAQESNRKHSPGHRVARAVNDYRDDRPTHANNDQALTPAPQVRQPIH